MSSSSSSNSPCAACKFLRRKCTPGCVFSPYFPSEQPSKFANVHRVFGASNVAKLLNELPLTQREDAVNSLAYEAEARIHDPVYGCVGYISVLQHRLLHLQRELSAAKKELSAYVGQAFIPQPVMSAMMGMGLGLGNPPMYRDQQQQLTVATMNSAGGFIQMGGAGEVAAAAAANLPVELVSPQIAGLEGSFMVQPLPHSGQQQNETLFQESYAHRIHLDQHQRRGSHEMRSGTGPSS